MDYISRYVRTFCSQEFCMVVFVGWSGKTCSVSFDDNFFSPRELVSAFKKVFPEDCEEDLPAEIEAYKKHLIEKEGVSPEELE